MRELPLSQIDRKGYEMHKVIRHRKQIRWKQWLWLVLSLLFLAVNLLVYAEEKQAVTLVSVSPMEGSYISQTPEFTLTFDKNVANVDVRDHNRSLISFRDGSGGEILIHVEIADDEIYPNLKREIKVQVLEVLSPGKYKLIVPAGIKAKNGTQTVETSIYYYRVKEPEPETETETETEYADEAELETETERESGTETATQERENTVETEFEGAITTETSSDSSHAEEGTKKEANLASESLQTKQEPANPAEPEKQPENQKEAEQKEPEQKTDQDPSEPDQTIKQSIKQETKAESDRKNTQLVLHQILLTNNDLSQETLQPVAVENGDEKPKPEASVTEFVDISWPFLLLLVLAGLILRVLNFYREIH